MLVKSASRAVVQAIVLAGFLAALAGCASLPARSPVPVSPGAAVEPQTGAPARPTETDRATAMVRSATAMLGQPYRFGGAAPGGFDCSGLVSFAAQSAGLYLPRTASEQLRSGVPVRRTELQAGDLIFMRLAHKQLHVGIAIGDGRFIHAPAAGSRVRIDSLTAHPYSAGFVGARRVIGSRISGL